MKRYMPTTKGLKKKKRARGEEFSASGKEKEHKNNLLKHSTVSVFLFLIQMTLNFFYNHKVARNGAIFSHGSFLFLPFFILDYEVKISIPFLSFPASQISNNSPWVEIPSAWVRPCQCTGKAGFFFFSTEC